ncbi:MAG: hypothetical protein ABEI31_11320 [Halodesulfurarchaeum sp.]
MSDSLVGAVVDRLGTSRGTDPGSTEAHGSEPQEPAHGSATAADGPDTISLSDLATAAFCQRKLYYRRREPVDPPEEYDHAMALAGRYREILDPDPGTGPDLHAADLHVPPQTYRENLAGARDRLDAWDGLVEPAARKTVLRGREVHGMAAKVLEDPLAPTIVSPGHPPPEGVWQPQSVRVVGLAKALAWERQEPVERAYVEYARHGTIREVPLTTRRKATYRRVRRAVTTMDGPPPRTGNDGKCRSCEVAAACGVRTRSLRSLI